MPRVVWEINRNKKRETDTLLKKSGCRNYKQLIELAISLLKWCFNQIEQGKAIGAITKDDKFTEVSFPEFNRVRLNAKK